MTDPFLAGPFTAVLVGAGGAFGAVSRHAVGLFIHGRESVVVVNALGSLVLGLVLSAPVGLPTIHFVAVGFCGAFTTFSSFAVETVTTAEDGEVGVATGFAVVNLIAAIGTVLSGLAVGGFVW